ncbi:[FeFe] hydrogenase H-cluster radical SAM maturase HydE [Pseudoramibacter porci]|uniref:[FeFe] hydrogenase H-cluster radical SAM maturase HydE n=1 Tax=Pseudoramibacter porci TaxID=2606631 RepID=A0A7X2NE96_9FIRM|nr:[FeFe] hydrogenase H-cluster radical SAM maturase HydE [Pseudoramibacter porci]MSS18972.1 [FeFe] hydrogenase H-cluster radical SAM maturase HydE [Pseudoramibacter porci]
MATKNEARIKQLAETRDLSRADLKLLLRTITDAESEELYAQARRVREAVYGKAVYLRGLIEFTNVCKNNCYYCGIRRDNAHVERYRLDDATILECCDRGYDLDFRTFVLQGGEDPTYSDARICNLVREIKRRHPDCAVTLSIGEKSEASYRAYFEAGADRYLLRHETANPEHYRTLHPPELSGENRKRCLKTLKAIGYQVGAGMMVGAPGQTLDYLVDDLVFMRALQPEMIGIGPFIPQKDTPFGGQPSGTLKMTLHLLAIIRLMQPDVLLPATTALGTIDPLGREKGILAGANVVMPNLSPTSVRGKYLLYDGKICTGDEAAECRRCMAMRIEKTGYHVAVDRGDHIALSNGIK